MMIYRSLSASVCSRFDQCEQTSNIFIYGNMAPGSSSETIVHIYVTPFSSWNGYFID